MISPAPPSDPSPSGFSSAPPPPQEDPLQARIVALENLPVNTLVANNERDLRLRIDNEHFVTHLCVRTTSVEGNASRRGPVASDTPIALDLGASCAPDTRVRHVRQERRVLRLTQATLRALVRAARQAQPI